VVIQVDRLIALVVRRRRDTRAASASVDDRVVREEPADDRHLAGDPVEPHAVLFGDGVEHVVAVLEAIDEAKLRERRAGVGSWQIGVLSRS